MLFDREEVGDLTGQGRAPEVLTQLLLRVAQRTAQLVDSARHPHGPTTVTVVALEATDDRRVGKAEERHATRGIESLDRHEESLHRDLLEIVERLAVAEEPASKTARMIGVTRNQRFAIVVTTQSRVAHMTPPDVHVDRGLDGRVREPQARPGPFGRRSELGAQCVHFVLEFDDLGVNLGIGERSDHVCPCSRPPAERHMGSRGTIGGTKAAMVDAGGGHDITEYAGDDVSVALERARDAVAEAKELLGSYRADLVALQQLAERLLEVCPPAVIVDDSERIRGMNLAAEQLLGTSANRAMGRRASSVLPDVDLTTAGRRSQVVEHPASGQLRVRICQLGAEATPTRLVVIEPDS